MVREDFERCWPWLEASLAVTGPTHTKEQIRARIRNKQAWFWPCDTCALITEVIDSPSGLRSYNGWLAGGDLDEIKRNIPLLEGHARTLDCDRVIVTGRRGWLRAFNEIPGSGGYRELGTRIAKDL